MFIHHILWFKSPIHLKEACAHGSRWARKEETPLSKTAEKQPNCFVLLSLWGFYTQKHGGRGFQHGETKLHLRGIERSQIQPFCWYTLGSQAQALHTMQHPQPSCVDQLGPPFVGYFLYSPHPSRHKGPLQVALSLCESYQLQTANGVLQWCWEVVDSICLAPFFKKKNFGVKKAGRAASPFRRHVDSQTSAADREHTQNFERIWSKKLHVVSNLLLSVTTLTPRKMASFSEMKTLYFPLKYTGVYEALSQ